MSQSVLVLPGAGKQGQLATRALLKQGFSVHSLVRNSSSVVSDELRATGVNLHAGDLGDEASIGDALNGIEAIFLALPAHPVQEIQFAKNAINAAKAKGVKQVIYTSVARTGQHRDFPFWSDKYPLSWYWNNKQCIEDLLRASNFEMLTILRPAFFMQNFCCPEVDHMFPGLTDKSHTLSVPFDGETKFDLIDINDIANFVIAAIQDPQEFSGKEIELAGDSLTAHEIAHVLSDHSGHNISVNLIGREEAAKRTAAGDMVMLALELQRDYVYGVRLDKARSWGIPLKLFTQALAQNKLKW
ncbi:hypothetical protein MBLNU13_g07024t1 [Cladosporium sp. NU13]